jgi:cobalt-zinc-cadmium efflux system outer membrane protein
VREGCGLLLICCLGCRCCPPSPTYPARPFAALDATLDPTMASPSPAEVRLSGVDEPLPAPSADLRSLWDLAVAHNPALREASAEVEAARGRFLQAGTYPNPRIAYNHDTLANSQVPLGTVSLQMSQEIVTAGKRRLDLAVTARGTDVALLALLGRKFEVLGRIRRARQDYLGWHDLVEAQEEVVTTLQQGVAITRKQVEVARTRPRTDLLRLQALLEEARIDLASSRAKRTAAWRQLAAVVGLPELPMPESAPGPAGPIPHLDPDTVTRRVLAVNTQLKQAAAEAEQARLAIERARAEVVPNVTVGGGFDRESVDFVQGAMISVAVGLPVWDRKVGHIHEAKARWAQAQAARRTLATRLSHDIAEAFGRYQAARVQIERLTAEVLPVLEESLGLLRKGYEAGAAQITFADLIQAQVSLNQARIEVARARRDLGLAIADLRGLMQIDVGEDTSPR